MTANPVIPWLNTSVIEEFLRRELAPTPGRWQAAFRLTLTCVICTIPIMMFHLKEPLLVMILMFAIVKDDKTTALMVTAVAILGATIGCGMLLAYYLCALDLTWLRVLLVPAFIGLALFINRIVTFGPVGYSIGLPLAIGVILPDTTSSAEFLNRLPFYFWWAAVLGLSVNLAVQFLLNPQTSQSVLVRNLTSRLNAVEALLRRLADGGKMPSEKSSLASLALAGMVEQFQVLKMSVAVDSWLKKHQAETRAQIILVDRLVTAAALLEIEGIAAPSELMKKRLRHIADACVSWRQAIGNRRPPANFSLPMESPTEVPESSTLPSLAEMERVVELMPLAFSSRALPDELKPDPRQRKGGVLVSDAFTNREYVRFAIKGALAGFICYLIFTLAGYPGIYTSVVTCVVCSLSTIGASAQKGVLRFAGAAVGGLLGSITLTYIFPHFDSLGEFWFPFAAVTGLAAYVNFGSPRISYCGIQIAVAFYKCVLQDYGPYTELRIARDRLIGIALGLIVFGIVNSQLWPVKALEVVELKLASALRLLAKLAGLPDKNEDPAPQLAEAFALRLRLYQDFGVTHEMLEGSKFEFVTSRREKLEVVNDTIQKLFLYLMAIIQHRPDLRPSAVPEPLRAASFHFRTSLAEAFEIISDRVEGKSERPIPELQAALDALEQTVARQINAVTDVNIIAEIRARLALYQKTVPIVMQLVRLQSA
jgi:multidrug resistance protein MdtO